MRIKLFILYDNQAKERFRAGWGFSCLVQFKNRHVLFDTGADEETLAFNAKLFGIEKSSIECCFISHMHADHTNGLGWLTKKTKVFLPGEYDGSVEELETITFDYPIKEQALVVDKKVMLVGCSHPGIARMAREAYERYGKLKLIIGGFHLLDESAIEIERIANELKEFTQSIAPCHCTGEKAIEKFKEIFASNFIQARAGEIIEVP